MKMESSKLTALLFIFMLSLSTIPHSLACDYCPKSPPTKKPSPPATPTTPASPLPITLPPVTVPPVTVPPIVSKPPVHLPPVNLPPIKPPYKLPPVHLPPMIKPPFKLPPVGLPPVNLPPMIKPPFKLPPVGLPPLPSLPPVLGGSPPSTTTPTSSCPTPPSPAESCPVDALKFGACVDVLGQTVQVGDSTVECCPVVDGLAGVAAAACLCTAIKAKLLDVSVVLPVALQVLVACGASVPAGYTCS